MADPDYQDFTTRDMPQAERRRLNVGDIWSNAAKCLSCGDLIRSANRHDFRTCLCGKLSVDGGSWYTRRLYSGEWEDMSEPYDDIEEESKKRLGL